MVVCFFPYMIDMIIGFAERYVYINESSSIEGEEIFRISINVTSQITSEQVHMVQFRLQEGTTNATIETDPPSSFDSREYDARFGKRAAPNEPIIDERDVEAGSQRLITELTTAVRDDFRSEGLECFTIRILSPDLITSREIFRCYEDGQNAKNFFCFQTICIIDNDG